MTEIPETVTRVMVVKDSNVTYEVFADSWEVYVQDDGHTLKLRGKGAGHEASAERSKRLGEDLRGTIEDVFQNEAEKFFLPDKILVTRCRRCGRPRGEHAAVGAVNDEHWCPLPPGEGLARFSETEMYTP